MLRFSSGLTCLLCGRAPDDLRGAARPSKPNRQGQGAKPFVRKRGQAPLYVAYLLHPEMHSKKSCLAPRDRQVSRSTAERIRRLHMPIIPITDRLLDFVMACCPEARHLKHPATGDDLDSICTAIDALAAEPAVPGMWHEATVTASTVLPEFPE